MALLRQKYATLDISALLTPPPPALDVSGAWVGNLLTCSDFLPVSISLPLGYLEPYGPECKFQPIMGGSWRVNTPTSCPSLGRFQMCFAVSRGSPVVANPSYWLKMICSFLFVHCPNNQSMMKYWWVSSYFFIYNELTCFILYFVSLWWFLVFYCVS